MFFLTKSCKQGVCFVALYVDDILIVGHPIMVQENIQKTRDYGLVLKVEDNLRDYLACDIVLSDDCQRA